MFSFKPDCSDVVSNMILISPLLTLCITSIKYQWLNQKNTGIYLCCLDRYKTVCFIAFKYNSGKYLYLIKAMIVTDQTKPFIKSYEKDTHEKNKLRMRIRQGFYVYSN